MHILGIETTGKLGSISLGKISEEEIRIYEDKATLTKEDILGLTKKIKVKELVTSEEMSHLKELTYLIDSILKEEKISPKDIDFIAVSKGPGSFTGIRIGVVTARTLGQFLDIPVISVSSLELFKVKSLELREKEYLAVIYNARRGQCYSVIFDNQRKQILKEGPYMLVDVLEKIKNAAKGTDDKFIFYGDGIDSYRDIMEEFLSKEKINYEFIDEEQRYQNAKLTIIEGLQKYIRGEYPDSFDKVLPNYMRMAEAEKKLKDGSLEEERKRKLEKFKKMANINDKR